MNPNETNLRDLASDLDQPVEHDLGSRLPELGLEQAQSRALGFHLGPAPWLERGSDGSSSRLGGGEQRLGRLRLGPRAMVDELRLDVEAGLVGLLRARKSNAKWSVSRGGEECLWE